MSTRDVDYESIAEIHRLLHEAADHLDKSAEPMPNEIHAGPFAPQVTKLIAPVPGAIVEAILRLRAAAFDVKI
ncbi:hypothetical protein DFJ64_0692 [Thermasporomyces composti]|uniref:Uncharacterized protein n=1 Tax=Thermasporomyces composti TaxID=696763 RepID=A0A3D9V1R2_THECX|nr:hypothetical protein DFJ64_0692 [Thermasporomyces composti]